MTDPADIAAPPPDPKAAAKRLRKRHAAERRFRRYGVLAITVGLAFLAFLIGDITVKAYDAFYQTWIRVDVRFDAAVIDPKGTRAPATLAAANYTALLRKALMARFPEAKSRKDIRDLVRLVSNDARSELRAMVRDDPSVIGTTRPIWVLASADADLMVKGVIPRSVPESQRRIDDRQLAWLDSLAAGGALEKRFNWHFFTSGDSRHPELAGIGGAAVGSIFTLLVTLGLAFPIGAAAAVYLEEFAPNNRWTEIIEVNINNLAAVPSIVFGLLGLALLLDFLMLPRSAPLVGGIVLALMTLPTVIIATRAALKSVPPSIREAARGMGASPLQVVAHHVLPLAMPGILTGTIIGMARALGETAPLLMIGMVAFIVDIPTSPLEPATVLPVQIFLWADSAERSFMAKTAAATLVLLMFLIAMNGLAVFLRTKFERRW